MRYIFENSRKHCESEIKNNFFQFYQMIKAWVWKNYDTMTAYFGNHVFDLISFQSNIHAAYVQDCRSNFSMHFAFLYYPRTQLEPTQPWWYLKCSISLRRQIHGRFNLEELSQIETLLNIKLLIQLLCNRVYIHTKLLYVRNS